MGRYYSGDIEGKFWFGVQSSDDASFFGGSMNEPSHISYSFDKNDLSSIKKGIARCKEILGEFKAKLDAFFNANNGYNDQMLLDAGFPEDKIHELLTWYARLDLGEKILKSVEDTGYCNFEAEI